MLSAPATEPAMQENGEESGEGKEAKEADPTSPKKCDIIIISGRREKCEAAKEALQVCGAAGSQQDSQSSCNLLVPCSRRLYLNTLGSGVRWPCSSWCPPGANVA